MSAFRHSILAATVLAAIGAGGFAYAADKDKHEDPTVRHCTNDPDLASDLYEYLQDCPAAQALLNRSGQWVAVERGTATTPGARSNMGTPSAPRSTGTMGTPSAPGGSTMGTPSAPSGGKAD